MKNNIKYFQTNYFDQKKIFQGQGWPAAFIAGDLPQRERLRVFDALMDVSIRVLVSTDLTSRGIDCETVDLVINMDVRFFDIFILNFIIFYSLLYFTISYFYSLHMIA